ncbi:hypothetical protein CHARACLAT_018721 [Characodon lateralis]|uniref:Uncharacterized protein n=1 Tax=Characodon lateralis TaxID=208331 RepID=A0ABU7EF15_9TELE|nr:hypothetical protein [Characodon lateralis]
MKSSVGRCEYGKDFHSFIHDAIAADVSSEAEPVVVLSFPTRSAREKRGCLRLCCGSSLQGYRRKFRLMGLPLRAELLRSFSEDLKVSSLHPRRKLHVFVFTVEIIL